MNKEEISWIKKVEKILVRKMKECLDENKEEDLTPLQKARFDTFKEILEGIKQIK